MSRERLRDSQQDGLFLYSPILPRMLSYRFFLVSGAHFLDIVVRHSRLKMHSSQMLSRCTARLHAWFPGLWLLFYLPGTPRAQASLCRYFQKSHFGSNLQLASEQAWRLGLAYWLEKELHQLLALPLLLPDTRLPRYPYLLPAVWN